MIKLTKKQEYIDDVAQEPFVEFYKNDYNLTRLSKEEALSLKDQLNKLNLE